MNSMTIGKKLTLAFAAMLVLVLGLGYAGLSAVGNLGNALDTEMNKTGRKIELGDTLLANAFQMRAWQRGVVQYSMLKDPAKVEQNLESFRTASNAMAKDLAELRPMLTKPTAQRAAESIQTGLDAWLPVFQEVVKQCAENHFDAELIRLLDSAATISKQIEAGTAQLVQVQKDTQAEAAQSATATVSFSRWIVFILIGISLIVGIVVLWVVRNISTVLRRLAGELGEGAEQTANAA